MDARESHEPSFKRHLKFSRALLKLLFVGGVKAEVRKDFYACGEGIRRESGMTGEE